jgi:hypothetical protein
MRKALLLSSVVFIMAAVLVLWRVHGAATVRSGPATSQIYVHGTPVCIMQDGDRIMAMIGECDASEAPQGLHPDLPGRRPFHGTPGLALPPGHPPVPFDLTPKAGRLIPV